MIRQVLFYILAHRQQLGKLHSLLITSWVCDGAMKASHSGSYLGVREIYLFPFQLAERLEVLLQLLLGYLCYSAFVFYNFLQEKKGILIQIHLELYFIFPC